MMGFSYPSKKAIKDRIKEGKPITFTDYYIETSMFGPEFKGDGVYTVVGPDPYHNRKWFGTLTVKNGLVVKVQ